LTASAAAQRLGVSIKALRVYEQRGLLVPGRTAAGYRIYGPDEMDRAAQIVALRALGLSLTQVARVLHGDPQLVDLALAAHEKALEKEIGRLVGTLHNVRTRRAELARGDAPASVEKFNVAFDLPWPWAGERFELSDIRPINAWLPIRARRATRQSRRVSLRPKCGHG
jgi:DNA-binding transcriptional MerR regulator